MDCRFFLSFSCLLLFLEALHLNGQTNSHNQTISIYSKTTVTTWDTNPNVLQQTDLGVYIPHKIFFLPSTQVRMYAIHLIPLNNYTLNTYLQAQEILQSDAIGLGIYTFNKQYRFLYGALTIEGLEGRITNLWGKAFTLPVSFRKTEADLLRTTSSTQKQDLAGFISRPLGQNSSLYSLIHSEDTEKIHGTMGFETRHIDKQTLRIEAGLCSHILPETSADTWFTTTPLLPQRQHFGASISLQWFSPLLDLTIDMASSYTIWEGTGYYYKGAFSLGPPSFQISGGYDTIWGSFRDSAGALQVQTAQEEKNRCRLQLFMRGRSLGSFSVNSELRFIKEDSASSFFIDEWTSSLSLTKGMLLSGWWLVPETFKLEGNYKGSEKLSYYGAVSLVHRIGNPLLWSELKSHMSVSSDQAQLCLPATQTELHFSIEGTAGIQVSSHHFQAGIQLEKESASPFRTSINMKGNYKKKSFALSSSLQVPIHNSTDCTASLSMNWSW